MDRAKAELAAAEAHVAEAKAKLTELEALGRIESPVSGRVVSLSAATRDRVARDGPVLVVQPDHDLWLRAVFYDMPTELLTPGYSGRFLPANGGSELSVRFAQRLPSLRPDGGLTAFFEATTSAPGWSGREAGELVVAGEPRSAMRSWCATPTCCFIAILGSTTHHPTDADASDPHPPFPVGDRGCAGARSRPRLSGRGPVELDLVHQSAPGPLSALAPELSFARVVGDEESETGPLATTWHDTKFRNPARDGAVLLNI